MADLTLNEYNGLNDEEIRVRLIEEHDYIHSGKTTSKSVIPVQRTRDRVKRIKQFILKNMKTIISKKRIPQEGNQSFLYK